MNINALFNLDIDAKSSSNDPKKYYDQSMGLFSFGTDPADGAGSEVDPF